MASKSQSLVRLSGIPLSQLPSPAATTEALAPFVHAILREALPFIYSATTKSGSGKPDSKRWRHKGDKRSPDSAAKVEAWERVVVPGGAGAPGKETWALRRSVHEDKAERGTASWAEFERCFRDEHAEAEDAFTPNVVATHEALVWDCAGLPSVREEGRAWGDFRLKVEEMRHKIGAPFKNRTFPVLQLTAVVVVEEDDAAGPGGENSVQPEFVVVSIPVPDFGESESSKLAREKGAQIASYISVERIRKLGDGRIEWLMATASDAGGVLPQFVQNMAMPGVVWKDVPLFLSWIAKERQERDVAKDGVVGKAQKKQAAEPSAIAGTARQDATSVITGPEATAVPQVSTGGATGAGATHKTEVSTGPEVVNLPDVAQPDGTTKVLQPDVATGTQVGTTPKSTAP